MRVWILKRLAWLMVCAALFWPAQSWPQEGRKVKSKINPTYPDAARPFRISGTVRLLVVVTPGGQVKSTKILGGHPLLAQSAVEAVKRWRFEPAAGETSETVEIKFTSSSS